jgi:hypothetical protein
MAEITKVYRQGVPAMTFIGKKYGNEDRVDGGFGAQWGQWFQNDWFAAIEKQIGSATKETCEDDDAYIGLMRDKEGEPFQYWIGIFAPEDTVPPEGFETVNFPAAALGVCWLYGKEGELFGQEDRCASKLGEAGYEIIPDAGGAWWFFERYTCPRFTTPDDLGNKTLDICFYVK